MLHTFCINATKCSSLRAREAEFQVALQFYLLNNQIIVLNGHIISTSSSARTPRSTSSHDPLAQLAQRWPNA
eukprot:6465602-Amphidinium_carterae.2